MNMPTIPEFKPDNTGAIYAKLAGLLVAIENCEKSGNKEWREKHTDTARDIVKRYFPHGSGFDNGTRLEFGKSNGARLLFYTAFHHMDDNGYYCGWTEHSVIITAHLAHGFTVRVTGHNKRDIKAYISDCFYNLC